MNNCKSILIVEDDEDLSITMKRSFERHNYVVECAKSLKEVEEIVKKSNFTNAVVDLKINGESGLEVIKFLNNFDKKIKMVMLTGYASITTTIMAIKSGACYYLAKPANVEMIIEAFDKDIFDSQKADIKITAKETSLKNLEWEHIHKTLVENNFNISKTAKILNMHRRTLSRKLQKRGI
jgi:two-component system response regulator RegA